MNFSAKVEDKFSAINVAEKIMYNSAIEITEADLKLFENYNEPRPFSKVLGNKKNMGLSLNEISDKYYYKVNEKYYYPEIYIYQSDDEKKLDLYRVHVVMK